MWRLLRQVRPQPLPLAPECRLAYPTQNMTPHELLRFRFLRSLMLPAALSVLGMLLALLAATLGQQDRRARDSLQMHYDDVYWQNELAQARLAGKPADEIAKL